MKSFTCMEGVCIKSTVKNVSFTLEVWNIRRSIRDLCMYVLTKTHDTLGTNRSYNV